MKTFIWDLKNTKRENFIRDYWIKKYVTLGIPYKDILNSKIACRSSIIKVYKKFGYDELLPGSGGDNAKVKFNPFNISSKNTMYWYGYLFGDGHITSKKYSIGLTSIDKEHLEKYIKYIGVNLTIHKRKSQNCFDVIFGNIDAHTWLKNRGFSKDKSYIGKLHYVNSAVLRGMFDSDGSCSLSSSPYFLTNILIVANQINDYLNKVGIRSYIIKHSKDDTCYNIRIPMSDFIKFYDFLYRKSTIETRLDRKFNNMRLIFEKKLRKSGELRET